MRVTTLTYQGHVISSVTWQFDSYYVFSCRCSVDTFFRSGIVTEIFLCVHVHIERSMHILIKIGLIWIMVEGTIFLPSFRGYSNFWETPFELHKPPLSVDRRRQRSVSTQPSKMHYWGANLGSNGMKEGNIILDYDSLTNSLFRFRAFRLQMFVPKSNRIAMRPWERGHADRQIEIEMAQVICYKQIL